MGIFGIFKRKDRQPEEERPAPVQAPRPAAAPPMTPKEADMKYVGSFLRDYRNAEDDPNFERRFPEFLSLVKAGSTIAQSDYGLMLLQIRPVDFISFDPERGVGYLRSSADAGNVTAMFYCWMALRSDRFVPAEMTQEERVERYQEACDYGAHAMAMGFEPAIMTLLDAGYGTSEKVKTVYDSYLEDYVDELEEKEDAQSLDTLGLFYQYGIYYERDLNEAKRYFEMARDKGSEAAAGHLSNPVFQDEEEDL